MAKISTLPENLINAISKFIIEKSSNISKIKNGDIFELLERYCTVIHYPLPESEDNDGFHIKRFVNGKEENFVFINTQKYNEKQIFTAAHELGHILELDKYLIEQKVIKQDDFELQEAAMNQFAAQFLMPETQFKKYLSEKLAGKTVFSEDEFIKIVVDVMNEFSVPFKAVLWRLCELSIINDKKGNSLLEKYKNQIPDLIKQSVCKKIGRRSRKKLIKGFGKLLNDAERLECFSESDILSIRKDFSIKKEPYEQNPKLKISKTGINDER